MAEESGRDGIDWLVLLGRGRQRCLEVRDERVVFVEKVSKRQGKGEAGICNFLFISLSAILQWE
ncbi:hypothetical protein C4D60_Mb06t10690 [Musa balbisiana]|uniref:Uncharacterized protein n=1 Tax=Musa balbisiana TaxID=52838 RepID=A0A4V4H3U3_MUSBA|nr:hypothetical protein C4D60_Mb06t10690 [Musa balbisiana]